MQAIQLKPEPYCPICGAKMILRKPLKGRNWKPFWGCNRFPDCEGTRSIGNDGKPEDDYEEWDNEY